MAITNGTYLESLVDPEVMADLIEKKLVDLMRFAPLAVIDNTLVGRPGDTISLPSYSYIGDATTVAEGEDIPISELEADAVTATVTKIAKGVQITDEAVLSGYGDPLGEASDQIALSLASQTDNQLLGVLNNIASSMTYTYTGTALDPDDDLNNALILFGEDLDEQKVLLCSPEDYALIRKSTAWLPASEIAAEIMMKGVVGEIYGMQVSVTNKLSASRNLYIVKPQALRVFMKRDTMVETDRNIINKSTIITGDKHQVCYLYDPNKAIKVKKQSGE